MSHHPSLLSTLRHGCWSECSCGWTSRLYTAVTGAHLAFGIHLVERALRRRPKTPASTTEAAGGSTARAAHHPAQLTRNPES